MTGINRSSGGFSPIHQPEGVAEQLRENEPNYVVHKTKVDSDGRVTQRETFEGYDFNDDNKNDAYVRTRQGKKNEKHAVVRNEEGNVESYGRYDGDKGRTYNRFIDVENGSQTERSRSHSTGETTVTPSKFRNGADYISEKLEFDGMETHQQRAQEFLGKELESFPRAHVVDTQFNGQPAKRAFLACNDNLLELLDRNNDGKVDQMISKDETSYRTTSTKLSDNNFDGELDTVAIVEKRKK